MANHQMCRTIITLRRSAHASLALPPIHDLCLAGVLLSSVLASCSWDLYSLVMTDHTDLECVSPTISTPIRKSCYFCRSRKIRCSGGQVCTACRARNMDCIYGREASKGRPRGSKSASASLKGASQKALGTALLPDSPRDQTNDDEATLSSLIHFPQHQPSSGHRPTPAKIDFSDTAQRPSDIKDRLVVTALEDIFRQEVSRRRQTGTDSWASWLIAGVRIRFAISSRPSQDIRYKKGFLFWRPVRVMPPRLTTFEPRSRSGRAGVEALWFSGVFSAGKYFYGFCLHSPYLRRRLYHVWEWYRARVIAEV